MKIHYSKGLKEKSRTLRHNATLSEVLFWNQVKARKFCGLQFMRQKPIGSYIVDFYCSKLKLAVEIDGESHLTKVAQDAERGAKLASIGIEVLRFSDHDVKTNMAGVFIKLQEFFDNRFPQARREKS